MSRDIQSLFDVSGKHVFITGATGFLGQTMVETFLINNARVMAFGRSDAIHELGKQWNQKYGNHIQVRQIDMYNIQHLEDELQSLVQNEKTFDVIINNAHELNSKSGFGIKGDPIESSTLDHWEKHAAGGLYWPAMITRILGSKMKNQGRGSIINISTMYAATAPDPNLYTDTDFMTPPGYSASKAGMIAFTKYVASFWGSYGVRCNAILPGPISNTQSQSGISVEKDDPFLKRLVDRTCLGRIGTPDDLSGLLLYLASDSSSFMTGQELVIDGGWTVR
ncbi:MAG: SDR family oxidoreductase [Candidatus Lindowbacteria bacterium]|nr:SDR family oxidoreductase [Candidatus Lindowbacteria bacterium]